MEKQITNLIKIQTEKIRLLTNKNNSLQERIKELQLELSLKCKNLEQDRDKFKYLCGLLIGILIIGILIVLLKIE